jgi:hypothetical protein
MPEAKAADGDGASGGKGRELTVLGAAGRVGLGAVVAFLTWLGSAFGFAVSPVPSEFAPSKCSLRSDGRLRSIRRLAGRPLRSQCG